MGKMISVQSIAVAVAATGMTRADEGKLFRFTIKHSIFLMAVMGILSMLFAYVFPGYVPARRPGSDRFSKASLRENSATRGSVLVSTIRPNVVLLIS